MYTFLLLIVMFYFVLTCFSIPLSYILFFLGLCVDLTFWQCFLFLQKVVLFHFFQLMQCHLHMLIHSVVLYQSLYHLGTIFLLCVTFHDAKLNIISDRGFNPVSFSKKDDSVPSILTALLVFY
jgi:hypothetical protein